MRALVVDDSRAIRSVLRRMLAEIGLDTDEAGDGRQALTLLERIAAPDVMLVDWNMPEMDGLAFVKAVRALPDLDAVPVVMVTTESEAERVIQALEAGANEYLMKPFTKEGLLSKLDLLGIAALA
jgi:two-component system, chemotaxis family, chemotaxis protein CheY